MQIIEVYKDFYFILVLSVLFFFIFYQSLIYLDRSRFFFIIYNVAFNNF